MPVNCQILYRDRFVPKATLFEQRGYLLGRDPQCDIHVDHADVSRRHAHLRYDGESWQLTDLNSSNGTFINGQRQTRIQLDGPMLVTLGSLDFQLTPLSHRELTTDINHAAWLQKRVQSALQQCAAAGSVAAMLDSARRTAMPLLNSDRAALIFLDTDTSIQACRGYPEWLDDGSFSGSTTLIRQAAKAAVPIAANNAQTHQHLQHQPSVQRHRIKAAIACPVLQAGQVIAVFYADSLHDHHLFTQQDIDLLQAFARQLAMHLSLASIDEQLEQLESRLHQQYA
ncbi:hypothetical protein IDSA_08065 [Pseudidiomarina salinarum]|uniref:FHA domain-containing protein n=1 Tax=Pseudidiomarina salinarum TaxID=435908 RepID=A0A094IYU1_9GAMM|nr:FHA domain-containing protein [Pseudidiomarina salinarum]KFZ31014.1 hypothetical protein IDSA_08065 [Pseudidiomarina salinarum]RUO71498.1 hypothetical protein CWI79_08760 [Pseudidiomarina salinarum]